MRYLSLFSGIEAATVAWEPLGWELVAFCEIDKFPSAVLAYRFPDVPNLGDITKVDWNEFNERYGTVDVIVGGSPCQSFSIAGSRESLSGESALCFEYYRAIQDVRPRWFLWENVPGVLSTRDNAFGQFIGKLEELGYGMAWRTLDAQFFGVAQRRRRVFLVGHIGGMVGAAAAVLFERKSMQGAIVSNIEKRSEFSKHNERNTYKTICMASDTAKAAIDVDLCGTLLAGSGAPPIIFTDPIRFLTPTECERLQGFPDDWTKVPYRGKPAEECPDGPRYKACGNSMAVPVIRWLGERIEQVDELVGSYGMNTE